MTDAVQRVLDRAARRQDRKNTSDTKLDRVRKIVARGREGDPTAALDELQRELNGPNPFRPVVAAMNLRDALAKEQLRTRALALSLKGALEATGIEPDKANELVLSIVQAATISPRADADTEPTDGTGLAATGGSEVAHTESGGDSA